MATVVKTTTQDCAYGPYSAGTLMTPEEFDRADFIEGWRYELIHGVLIVTPPPLEGERDPNEELGYLLRTYRDTHPQGASLNATLPEETVETAENRRRADRVIWAGLGRHPYPGEKPTIAVEFVSRGRRNRERDYQAKRDEYLAIGVSQYWIIDRFDRTMSVFVLQDQQVHERVLQGDQIYTTDLLPGFELPLARLFAVADRWNAPGPAPSP